jgi:cytochrome P450
MQYSDLCTPSFYSDPYPVYQEIREAGPLVSLAPNIFITGRHSVALGLLNDPRLKRGVQAGVMGSYIGVCPGPSLFRLMLQPLLGPNQSTQVRLRRLLTKAFDIREMENFRRISVRVSNRLADDLVAIRRADLIADFAARLPGEIICSLLDVPPQDTLVFMDAVHHTSAALRLRQMTPRQIDIANQAGLSLGRYFASLLEFRRKHPGEDLISKMIVAEDDGQRFTTEEVVANILLLLVAGQEAIANMIGNALIALHRHPDLLQAVISDPEILPRAVCECIRYDSSVQSTARVVLDDMEVEGVYVERGSTIDVCVGAANRDPGKFEEPDLLRADRPVEVGSILSFGGGLHSCLSARLVLTEIEAALAALFARFPNMRIDNISSLRWRWQNALRGVESLHAVLI